MAAAQRQKLSLFIFMAEQERPDKRETKSLLLSQVLHVLQEM